MRDWDSINQLSKHKRIKSRISGKKNLQLWELIEQSLPILIGDNIWRVRILYHKIEKRFYVDVRQVTLQNTEDMNYYLITDNGILLPLSGWSSILETVFKFIRKYTKK